ncbi:MAG: autotransporter outer membrane beta-barrel domain-containing protein [Verrucomicrobiota bacterium]
MKLLPAALALLVCSVSGQAQQVIFNDDFILDPSLNGWTESISTNNSATGDISATGVGTVEIEKTGGSQRLEGRITRVVSTVGFESLTINLTAFQSPPPVGYEGGSFGSFNTDSLSVYIDTGAGFVPLFQRTGAWGPVVAGFTNGGNGTTSTPTASGEIALPGSAANISNLGIQIETYAWALDESYFLDLFTLSGVALPQLTAPVLIQDDAAVASFQQSAVPFASALSSVTESAVKSGGRDINERLFRLRSGLGQRVRRDSVGAAAPEEFLVDLEAGVFDWFVAGDFGSSDANYGSNWSSDTETLSSSLGFEYVVAENVALGLGYTHLETDSTVGRLGEADLTGEVLHGYASILPTRRSYISVHYAYYDLEHDLTRNSGFGTLQRAAPDGKAHRFSIDLGANFEAPLALPGGDAPLLFGPFFSLEGVEGEIDGFAESGSSRFAANVAEQDFASLVAELGLQASTEFSVGDITVRPQVRAAIHQETRGEHDVTTVGLIQTPFALLENGSLSPSGGLAAETSSVSRDRTFGSLGTALQFNLSDLLTIGVEYEGYFFAEDLESHHLTLRGRRQF